MEECCIRLLFQVGEDINKGIGDFINFYFNVSIFVGKSINMLQIIFINVVGKEMKFNCKVWVMYNN